MVSVLREALQMMKRLALALVLCGSMAHAQMMMGLLNTSGGTPATDTVKVDTFNTAGIITNSTIAASVTVGNNANRMVVAWLGGWTDGGVPAVSSFTCGGNAMTMLDTVANSNGNFRGHLYYYIGPSTGSNSVSATLASSATELGLVVVSLYNVNQSGGSSTFGTVSKTTGTASPASLSPSSQVRDLVLGLYESYDMPFTGLASGETEIARVDGGAGVTDLSVTQKAGAAGTVTVNQNTSAVQWIMMAVSVHHSGS